MIKKQSVKLTNLGILILRIGLGIMFIIHGYPKVFGGPEMWKQVGAATQYIGIDAWPIFFGFMAGIAEFFGGLFLLLGLFFRTTLGVLIVLMIVATASHLGQGDSFGLVSHPVELAIVFISLLFIGPGKHNLDSKLLRHKRRF